MLTKKSKSPMIGKSRRPSLSLLAILLISNLHIFGLAKDQQKHGMYFA